MNLYSAQRTIFNISLQLAMLSGKEYKLRSNSTLNQLLDIEQQTVPPTGKYPLLHYFCIGSGGIGSIDENTVDYPYTQHSATDASLFRLNPFILRTTDNDITDDYKQKYRLRKIITHNGVNYIAYYLKKFDIDNEIEYSDEIMQVNNFGGTSVLDVLSDDSDFLNPQPVVKKNNIISDTSSYVLSTIKYTINLDDFEINEIKNAAAILGYTPKITEIGLCTGLDMSINGSIEAIGVQVGFHIDMTVDLGMTFTGNRIKRVLEVGGQCPMLN